MYDVLGLVLTDSLVCLCGTLTSESDVWALHEWIVDRQSL